MRSNHARLPSWVSTQVCEEQLLQTPEQLLLEKENSGCEALLRDNKVRAPSPLRIARGSRPRIAPPRKPAMNL